MPVLSGMTWSAAPTRATSSSGASSPARPATRSSTSAAGPAASPSTSPVTVTGSRASTSTPTLVAAFNERAASAGLPAEATVGDARDFSLEREFALVMAPMQLIQVLAGPAERIACLRRAAGHLRPGAASRSRSSTASRTSSPTRSRLPLPDAREVDGWVYSSLPLDAALDSGAIVVRRLRQTVSPDGELTDELDEIPLRLLRAETIEAEAREAGLEPVGRREVAPTDAHVGSVVLLLEAR